ncbi:hypothetical protein ACIP5U_34360 [Streptomyces sp. NPDC088788]|uniref:hypothetical protein n=1 Tax=Streptomyces sp. NPDC088788 TaxID=3365898 RepID=UPI00381E8EF9
MATVSALGLLSRHATDRAGAMGGCVVRAELAGPRIQGTGDTAYRPLLLTSATMQLAPASRAAASGTAEIGTFIEDLVHPGKALIQAADLLLTRLGRQFGQIESVYTTRDGAFVSDRRTPYFPGTLYDWATKEGLDVQDGTN